MTRRAALRDTPLKILVVDPGPHVGVAWWASDGLEENFEAFATIPTDLYKSAEGWVEWADVVVVESFQIGGQRGRASNETIEQIGIMRYLCERHSTKLVEQTAAESKICTDKKLRVLGWWTRESGDHARSATRHLVAYLLSNDSAFVARMNVLLSSGTKKEENATS